MHLFLFYVMWVVLPACLSGHHVYAVPTEDKEDSLDLELWMVVNYHVGAGTKPGLEQPVLSFTEPAF